MEKGDTQGALAVFERLSAFAERSYLGLEGLVNLAVLHEDAGDLTAALSTWQSIIDEHADTVHVPHALFSVGRISEGLGETDAALVAYQRLRSEHPQSGWTDYAVNRIIGLESSE